MLACWLLWGQQKESEQSPPPVRKWSTIAKHHLNACGVLT